MPRKNEFDPDLVRVNIKRKDFNKLSAKRRHKEPFYSILHRILEIHDTPHEDLEFLLKEQIEATQTWMKKAQEKQVTLLDY